MAPRSQTPRLGWGDCHAAGSFSIRIALYLAFDTVLMIAGFPAASKIEFWMQAQKEMSALG